MLVMLFLNSMIMIKIHSIKTVSCHSKTVNLAKLLKVIHIYYSTAYFHSLFTFATYRRVPVSGLMFSVTHLVFVYKFSAPKYSIHFVNI